MLWDMHRTSSGSLSTARVRLLPFLTTLPPLVRRPKGLRATILPIKQSTPSHISSYFTVDDCIDCPGFTTSPAAVPERMISPWWGVGVAVPAVALKLFSKDGKTKRDEDPSSRLDDEDATEPSFRCERVCTSDRLMRRMGGLSKASTLQVINKI